jgi:thiamine-monophosphate kinase
MAGKPVCALAWVGLPQDRDMGFAKDLSAGMAEAAERFFCPVVGGDITSWNNPLSIGTAIVARPAGVRPVRRSGAKPGDLLFVTGELGGSCLGRHLEFVPRVAEARQLAALVTVHAMIDLSDGLSTDLAHLCEESGVGAEVEARAVPISRDARRAARADGRPALAHALDDGEDFELLFAVGPKDAKRLLARSPLKGLRLSHIGRVTRGRKVMLAGPDGRRKVLEPRGWEHFR